MKNKIFVLFFLIPAIFLLAACESQQSVYPPEDCLFIEFEPQYNLNEDVKVKISIGLQEGYQEKYSNSEELKYILGYSKSEDISDNEEITKLLTITDFSSDLYCYTKTEDKLIFNFCEQFTIEKEIFNSSDHFYIFMYNTTSDEQTISLSISYKIEFEKSEDSLLLHFSV